MFCKNCGAEITNEAIFCPYCGASVYAQSVSNDPNDFAYTTQNSAQDINTYNTNPYYPQQAEIEKPTLTNCYKKFWKNYATFSGRSRRSEYWLVVVVNLLISLVNVIPYVGQGIYIVYALATLVPMLALIVRRLHDIGKEWYNIFFALIPIAGFIIMLVWLCQDSQPGSNSFGPNPKGVQ